MREVMTSGTARTFAMAVLAAAPLALPAQHERTDVATPVARRAADVWNAQETTRANGAFDLASARAVDGSVAVINGPVTVSGHIHGSLVAINADVRLLSGARVDRDVIVVGGTLTGADSATLGGEILQQAELLRYHLDGDVLQLDREPEYDDSWWQRHRIRKEWAHGEASSEFLYVASRTYNRVEGWSFVAGPRFERPTSFGSVNVELFGVARTASPRQWDEESIGHDAKVEFLFGKPIGVALGTHAFDLVQPTEDWQLGETEAGLAVAALHRDYRDYYARHGGDIYTRFVAGSDVDLTFALSDEQWASRAARDPWSLMDGSSPWRPNPIMDAGQVHLLTTHLRIDTREREASPFAGWYVTMDLEQGGGRLTRFGAPVQSFTIPSPEQVWYSRGFVDVRRYNRIAPSISLDLRIAGGGWLAGDPLPTQRRLGVGGPGTMPGYAFRDALAGSDILNCSRGFAQAGVPAQCDRVALAQVQLRSGFLFGGWRDDHGDADWWVPGFNNRTSWVLFADAGRGWVVGQGGAPGDPLYAGRNALPPLDSFKIDLGAGIDFGGLGLYWAKAMNNGGDDPVRFTVRLQHRF